MLATSSDSIVPSPVLPWLGVALALVCLAGLLVVLYRIVKDGLKTPHLMMLFVCLASAVFIILGREAVREIFRTLNVLQDTTGLMTPSARPEQLAAILDRARTHDERVLAFDVYSGAHPQAALEWATDPRNRTLQEHPDLRSVVADRKPTLKALVLADEVAGGGPATVTEIDTVRGILDLGRNNVRIATMLKDGRFDFAGVNAQQFNQLLRDRDATQLNGNKIVLKQPRPP